MYKGRRSLLLFAALMAPLAAQAAGVPNLVAQQGRLLNSDGTAVTVPVTLTFALYSSATGAAALWAASLIGRKPRGKRSSGTTRSIGNP